MIKINARFKALIPPLTAEELAGLEENLVRDGCRDPLVVWGDVLVDGHNRFEICQRRGLPFKTAGLEFADEEAAAEWVIRNQFGRRNLSAFSRCELAAKLEKLIAEKAKQNQKAGGVKAGKGRPAEQGSPTLANPIKPVDTREEVAKAAGVSHGTIAKAKDILEKASEETKERLRRGETTINREASIIRREEKKREHEAKVAAAAKVPKQQEIVGPFDIILADPPWRYEHCEADNREIENHYETAELKEIEGHIKHAQPAADCILFLWATAPKLDEALGIMKAWGFNYRSCAVWDKLKIGMGYWFRVQHELLLIGVRGKPGCTPESERVSSIFTDPRVVHSKKPECVFEWIERAFPGQKKIELYCRQPRSGWAAWGNEV